MQGQKKGLVFTWGFQGSLFIPNQATPPLSLKLCIGALGPRTAGGGRKSRDSKLRNGCEKVIGGSGNSGAQGSLGGLPGIETETTLFHFPDVISREESSSRTPSGERDPDPCTRVFSVGP